MIEGYIDYVDEGWIAGWAYDSDRPGLRLLIEIVAGSVSRTVLADGERTDLREAGKGDGRHGFAVTLGVEVMAAPEVRARIAPNGPALNGSPFRTDFVSQTARRAGLDRLRSEAQQARTTLGLSLRAADRAAAERMPAPVRTPRQKLRDVIRSNVIGTGSGARRP